VQIKVICGNDDCRKEFPVSSEDPEWECPSCGRRILNMRYPFLTARLMQGTIDKDAGDWKALYSFLLERARSEIEKRDRWLGQDDDLSFLDEAQRVIDSDEELSPMRWKVLHDHLLSRSREAVLKLDRKRDVVKVPISPS
jgi:DNA-directed RNA polymerase subunit RPC12/RpoP